MDDESKARPSLAEQQRDIALRARCPGNGDEGEPVDCQSYEAGEQGEPCPPGCCVMAEEKDVRSILAAIELEEGAPPSPRATSVDDGLEYAAALCDKEVARLQIHRHHGFQVASDLAVLIRAAKGKTVRSHTEALIMGINDDALNEAGWELLRCAGPAIHVNRCKEVARQVVVAYINSLQRIHSAARSTPAPKEPK